MLFLKFIFLILAIWVAALPAVFLPGKMSRHVTATVASRWLCCGVISLIIGGAHYRAADYYSLSEERYVTQLLFGGRCGAHYSNFFKIICFAWRPLPSQDEQSQFDDLTSVTGMISFHLWNRFTCDFFFWTVRYYVFIRCFLNLMSLHWWLSGFI